MSPLMLFIIIILEGFVSISIEILAIRQVVPFYGSNIINTSIIISAFLLFLSLGYYQGGRVKGNYIPILQKNLNIVLIVIIIGLSNMSLQILDTFVPNQILFLTFMSLFIVAPITYLLGQTVPILSNFFETSTKGELSGKILFLSTIGSFLGSLLSSTVLLNYFGVNFTLLFITIVILIVQFILSKTIKNKYLAIASILLIFNSYAYFNTNIYIKTNEYSHISIQQEKDNIKVLIVNNQHASNFNSKTKESTFWYTKELKKYFDTVSGKNILIAGGGGFTIGYNDKKNKYTFVEIDDDLKSISEEYLLKDKINGEYINEDIRVYLKTNNKKYDVIVIDAFVNIKSIPSSLVTNEYYKQVSNSLSEDGILIMNVIVRGFYSKDFNKHINQTITNNYNCLTTFKEPISILINKSDNLNNILYWCVIKEDDLIYKDEKLDLFEISNI